LQIHAFDGVLDEFRYGTSDVGLEAYSHGRMHDILDDHRIDDSTNVVPFEKRIGVKRTSDKRPPRSPKSSKLSQRAEFQLPCFCL
jgi:hypothetical protein